MVVRQRSGVRAYKRRGFTRPYASYRSAAVSKARSRPAMGRYAGYYRKSGYYGRFRGSGGELKFHDVGLSATSIATGGVFIPAANDLTVIAQGTGESERIGRKIVIKKIQLRYRTTFNGVSGGSGPEAPETLRIMLVQDKQTNGSLWTTGQLMEDTTPYAFRNLANSGRFNVLMEKTLSLDAGSGMGNGTSNDVNGKSWFHSWSKICNIPIEYDSTTGAITEHRTNSLRMIVFAETGTQVSLEGVCRLRYSD